MLRVIVRSNTFKMTKFSSGELIQVFKIDGNVNHGSWKSARMVTGMGNEVISLVVFGRSAYKTCAAF